MMTEKVLRIALAALVLTSLAGCELLDPETEEPPLPGSPDLTALTEPLDSLLAGLHPITATLAAAEEARPAIEENGADLGGLMASPGTDLAIPPSAGGATYVRNPSTHEYEWDDAREDAPADGIRIVRYRRTSDGGFLIPLAETGFIDLTPDPENERALQVTAHDSEGAVTAFTVIGDEQSGVRTRGLSAVLEWGSEDLEVELNASARADGGGAAQGDFQAALQAGPYYMDAIWQGGVDPFGESGGFFDFGFRSDENVTRFGGSLSGLATASTPVEGEFLANDGIGRVEGTFGSPTFDVIDAELTSAEMQALAEIWAMITGFIETWSVPIES